MVFRKIDLEKENGSLASKFINERWIVVTTINNPTEQCKNLSDITDFQLLVIGDIKTPKYWKQKNSIFLNIFDQKSLKFSIFQTTPTNSYNRKNIGYLFAIMHGAKFIYDTDDDNSPLVNLSQYFNYNDFDFGLTFKVDLYKQNNQSFINPYAHFGQPTIWPRGYPLNEIKNIHLNQYYAGKRKSSIIQQGLVNGDPDVDAIFRLTKSRLNKKFDLYFDSSSPSVQIPKYMFSPFNSQNTLFTYKAFWSLYLPTTVSFRLTDIWRSYWAQRLLWLIDETITFRGPSAYQIRNSHSYLKDFDEENSMYLKTENLVKFLLEWECLKDKFYECVIDLSIQMAIHDFWGNEEIDSIKRWLNDLNSIGYKEPEISNFETNDIKKTQFEVKYSPNFQKGIDFENYCCDGNQDIIYEKVEKYSYFKKYCNSSKFKIELNDILNYQPLKVNYSLLITFNYNALADNIYFIKKFYEDYFQNIIFCGSNILNLLNQTRYQSKKFDSFSFIEFSAGINGNFHYYCMNKAIEMNYNTEGILLMSDDVLLKYWKLNNLNQNKIWYVNYPLAKWDFKNIINAGYFGAKFWRFQPRNQINALKNLWNEFDKIIAGKNDSDKYESERVKNFLLYLKNNQEPNTSIAITPTASDLFYLPKNKLEFFYFISQIFVKNDVFLETAVPTILKGIDEQNSKELITGAISWNGVQFNFSNYNKNFHFAHPVKISKKANIEPICELFIKERYSFQNKKKDHL